MRSATDITTASPAIYLVMLRIEEARVELPAPGRLDTLMASRLGGNAFTIASRAYERLRRRPAPDEARPARFEPLGAFLEEAFALRWIAAHPQRDRLEVVTVPLDPELPASDSASS